MHSMCMTAYVYAALLDIDSLDSPAGWGEGQDGATVIDRTADPSESPEAAFFRKDLYGSVAKFVETLPPRLREIAIRFYWDEQSQAQISADLKLDPSNVCRALKQVTTLGRAFFGITDSAH